MRRLLSGMAAFAAAVALLAGPGLLPAAQAEAAGAETVAAASATWSWENMGSPPNGLVVESAIGSISVKDGPKLSERPYTYVKGSDGHVWERWWNGETWKWSDRSNPPNVKVASGLGALTVTPRPGESGELPRVFVRGEDNHVWGLDWTGIEWEWNDHGVFPGGGNFTGLGVVNVRDAPNTADRPYIFVKDNSGKVWINYWNGKAWRWDPSGSGPDGGQVDMALGVVGRYNGKGSVWPVLFVRGLNSGLWTYSWDGTSWVWEPEGKPISNGVPVDIDGPVAAIVLNDEPEKAGRPYLFVRGSDSHLWTRWWTGSSWKWTDQGQPSGSKDQSNGVAAGLGGVSIDGYLPQAFVKADDGRMWANRWTGEKWVWENRGVPRQGQTNSVGIRSRLGAIQIKDGPDAPGRPYIFVKGTDDNVWLTWLN